MGSTRNHTTLTIYISKIKRITTSITNWITHTPWLSSGLWYVMMLICPQKLMLVCAKIKLLVVEMGGTRTNTTSNIIRSDKLTLPPHIQWIRVPYCFGMTRRWIIYTPRWRKITTIKLTINIFGGEVDAPITHTTFSISISNTKLIITAGTNLITPNLWLRHGGFYAINMRWNPPPHSCMCQNKLYDNRVGWY